MVGHRHLTRILTPSLALLKARSWIIYTVCFCWPCWLVDSCLHMPLSIGFLNWKLLLYPEASRLQLEWQHFHSFYIYLEGFLIHHLLMKAGALDQNAIRALSNYTEILRLAIVRNNDEIERKTKQMQHETWRLGACVCTRRWYMQWKRLLHSVQMFSTSHV